MLAKLPVPVPQVKKQLDGKLTVVMTAKDGSKVEIADNDQVLMATGMFIEAKKV